MDPNSNNIDMEEIAKFRAQAGLWWDAKGEFKALHDINPVRLAYIDASTELRDKCVLDVGCGGGLLCEGMAAKGARVTGIDAVGPALKAAAAHAKEGGLPIVYQQATAEAWAQTHGNQYDVVTCMELLEHVPDPGRLVQACGQMVRPGGDLVFATVNRTWLARLLVIWVSEYVVGIVRKGTHAYGKLVRPQELIQWGAAAGLTMQHISGLRYLPVIGYAALCRNTALNYLVHFKKPGHEKKRTDNPS